LFIGILKTQSNLRSNLTQLLIQIMVSVTSSKTHMERLRLSLVTAHLLHHSHILLLQTWCGKAVLPTLRFLANLCLLFVELRVFLRI